MNVKKYFQLATTLGSLTALPAALLAQTPPAPAPASAVQPGAPVAPGSVPGIENPTVPPGLQPISPPPEPMNPMNPVNPTSPANPQVYAAPVGPVNSPVNPSTPTPTTPPALNNSGVANPVAYSAMDSDGDGKISPAEYSMYQSRTNAAAMGANPTPPPAAKRGFWSRMFHGDDKTVSAGASIRSNPNFIDLDTNHDGYLSQVEIDAGNSLKK